jgi:hypothetical protein
MIRVKYKDGTIEEMIALKGDRGEKGDSYILTEADKVEIIDQLKQELSLPVFRYEDGVLYITTN